MGGAPRLAGAVTITASDVWLLVAVAVLLALAALLAAAESALGRVTRPRAEDFVDEERRGADALLALVSQPERFLSTLVFLRLTCLIVQATLVGIVARSLFGATGMALACILDVVAVFVAAETAPRTWAVLDPERAALAAARPVLRLTGFPPLRLVARALIGLTNVVLPGKGLAHGPYVSSEEELLAVAELGVEEGVIEEGERALIESIIEFGDTIVREVMVPRPDMVTVKRRFRVADVVEVMLLNGYSRVPVCGDRLDDIAGLAYLKDLMGAERDGKAGAPVADVVRPARFVPETKRVPDMLREMQRDKFHMAIVVDEYGGTAGLVTLEDIIEELVGEIADEYDVETPRVEELPGGGIRAHGRTPLDEVNDRLRARLPEGDWDTIGGLVYDQIGHVPAEGESVTIDGWRLTAQRIQGRRIGRVTITPETPDPPSPATPPDDPPARAEADGPAGGSAGNGDAGRTGGRGPGRGRGRDRDDRGQIGGIEALPFGILIFVVGTLLVLNVWAVIDAKLATDAAATQAARTFVEADVGNGTTQAAAEDQARAAGLAAFDAHGLHTARASLTLASLEGAGGPTGFTRCARADFAASYHVPALTVPWVGGFGHGFTVTSHHSQLIDPLRSGVPGRAEGCD